MALRCKAVQINARAHLKLIELLALKCVHLEIKFRPPGTREMLQRVGKYSPCNCLAPHQSLLPSGLLKSSHTQSNTQATEYTPFYFTEIHSKGATNIRPRLRERGKRETVAKQKCLLLQVQCKVTVAVTYTSLGVNIYKANKGRNSFSEQKRTLARGIFPADVNLLLPLFCIVCFSSRSDYAPDSRPFVIASISAKS